MPTGTPTGEMHILNRLFEILFKNPIRLQKW